jgi:phosphoserine aminotransferase
MLAAEDALDALKWAESIGGRPALIARCKASFAAIEAWVAGSGWAAFLAERPETRSRTSVCLKITDPWFTGLAADRQAAVAKGIASRLEAEAVAFDIGAYRDAPPGLRIWCGATVETADVQALLPWLDWAYATVKAEHAAAVA